MFDQQNRLANACRVRPDICQVLVAFLRTITEFIPLLALLLFLGALLWARRQDPFSRQWFTLKVTGHKSIPCVIVLSKPIRRYPVVVYIHRSGGIGLTDGKDLRQMAEIGFATVSVEYDQTNETAFAAEFTAALQYLSRQSWVNTNAIAWVGEGLGSDRLMTFARHHPEQQPQLLVLVGGNVSTPSSNLYPPTLQWKCPLLLVRGGQDESLQVKDVQRLTAVLKSDNVPVTLKIIAGAPHDLAPERGAVFRGIGEYCLTRMAGANTWTNYHSIARWQAEAPPFWLFCLPAVAWALGHGVWRWRRRVVVPEKTPMRWYEIGLRWLAVIMAAWALTETCLHLIPPHLAVSDNTLTIARRIIIQPKQRADFETLAAQPIWAEQKLYALLEHVELAGYNRELINWQPDDPIYRDFVLSPVITGKAGEDFAWRRPLWEEFYPRIRHESSPEDAAAIVVRHLRERVTIAGPPHPAREVPAIWLQQLTDETGFEIIYVAALRSVGVPARLSAAGQAEFYAGGQWQPAPRPAVSRW